MPCGPVGRDGVPTYSARERMVWLFGTPSVGMAAALTPPPAGLKATETAGSNGVIYRGTPPGRTKPETAERGLIPHAKPTR